MAERLPLLEGCNYSVGGDSHRHWITLRFDSPLTDKQRIELQEHVKLKFAGQLRRDPDAKQTPPPPPEAGD